MTSIQYRIVSGVCVPLALAVFGILGKRLTRGSTGRWKRSDFYLGVELALAGVASALVTVFEIGLKPGRQPEPSDMRFLLLNFVTAFFGAMLFMYVITLHQDYENESNVDRARTKEIWILAGLSNMIGFAVLLAGVALMPV